ncbi:hypothetical protein J6590_070772 [Homalodisca vitripennis]|nr:hypothetical protein J6590_070772 [Homalodisca vitripennis]
MDNLITHCLGIAVGTPPFRRHCISASSTSTDDEVGSIIGVLCDLAAEFYDASSVTSEAADEATSVGTSTEFLVASKAGLVTAAGIGFLPVNMDAWNAPLTRSLRLTRRAGSGPGVEQAGCESDAGGVDLWWEEEGRVPRGTAELVITNKRSCDIGDSVLSRMSVTVQLQSARASVLTSKYCFQDYFLLY